MRRWFLILVSVLAFLSVATAQDAAPPVLARVMGLDGQPWPIKLAPRKQAPDIETFDAPYVLTPGATRPALWYLDGDSCEPVTWNPTAKRLSVVEVVQSGGAFYLTYVADGVNEFWHLDGAKAAQVILDGKPLSQRARITRGGEAGYLYQGGSDGDSSLFELKGAEAVPVKLPAADIGTLSYAWHAADRLLGAFYKSGTYDFHVLTDGAFIPAWDGNGAKDYDSQADEITDIRAGERLFLSISRRGGSADAWLFDGAKLTAVRTSKAATDFGDLRAGNARGVYFIASGSLMLADGAEARLIKLPAGPLSLACLGGSVLVQGESDCWMVSGETVDVLPGAEWQLVAHAGGRDILRGADGRLLAWLDGLPLAIADVPADFGAMARTISLGDCAYLVELSGGEAPAYRFWLLR